MKFSIFPWLCLCFELFFDSFTQFLVRVFSSVLWLVLSFVSLSQFWIYVFISWFWIDFFHELELFWFLTQVPILSSDQFSFQIFCRQILKVPISDSHFFIEIQFLLTSQQFLYQFFCFSLSLQPSISSDFSREFVMFDHKCFENYWFAIFDRYQAKIWQELVCYKKAETGKFQGALHRFCYFRLSASAGALQTLVVREL